MCAFQDFLFWPDSPEWAPLHPCQKMCFIMRTKWKLWSRERQEGEGEVTMVLRLSRAVTFFSFPKNIFEEKTKAFAVPLWEWFGMLTEAKRPFLNWLQPFFGLSYTIVFIWEPEIYSEWILTGTRTCSHCNFHLPVQFFLYLLNLNCFLARKKM